VNRRLPFFALAAALAGCGSDGASIAPPPVAQPVTFQTELTNFDRSARPVVRFDVDGHALDAHEGQIRLFGDTYYLYGTSYDCGFAWQERGTPFCGFKVYSSPDLVHWNDRGFLFDARTPAWQARCDGATYGCYRPHVARNPRTGRYLLWINGYDVGVGFHVFESAEPTGPFVELAAPTLAVNDGLPPGVNNGDHDLFVDEDGRAYLAYTDWRRQGDLVIEQLDDGFTSGSGRFIRLGLTGREGPALFRRGDRYYLTMTDHTCPTCSSGTAYLSAPAPLGPWTGRAGAPITISATSCGGPSAAVTALPGREGPIFLLQSDLWKPGDRSQALADHYWGPLDFAADGAIEPLRCQGTVELELAAGQPSAARTRSDLDQSTGVEGFRLQCDLGRRQRLQTFTAGRGGRLTRVGLTTFAVGPTTADLALEVVRLDGSGLPAGALASAAVPAIRVGRTAREVSFALEGAELVEGQRYGLLISTLEEEGCYGFAYRDDAHYPRGQHRVSEDEGESWDLEPDRALKFTTTVP
jgi:Glycosyl hydrolases family 43